MKKTCTKCGEEKELELFVKNKRCKYRRRNICSKCHNFYIMIYYYKNKERVSEINKRSYYKTKLNNPEKLKLRRKKSNDKRKTDNMFKLRCNISTLIRKGMYRKKYLKKTKTQNILGCSFEEFKRHLESQFQVGMTWDNYGRNGWHIDHIYPVSKARDERHLIELNHYTNLQPLWEKDNLSKGNKIL